MYYKFRNHDLKKGINDILKNIKANEELLSSIMFKNNLNSLDDLILSGEFLLVKLDENKLSLNYNTIEGEGIIDIYLISENEIKVVERLKTTIDKEVKKAIKYTVTKLENGKLIYFEYHESFKEDGLSTKEHRLNVCQTGFDCDGSFVMLPISEEYINEAKEIEFLRKSKQKVI
ncbi:MAG: hypothetical protein R3Y21_01945 [Mycoplasmatota bacterium]